MRKINKEEDIKKGLERMCSMCQEVKSIAEFKVVRQKGRNDYYHIYCDNCRRLYYRYTMRGYRETHPDYVERGKKQMREKYIPKGGRRVYE